MVSFGLPNVLASFMCLINNVCNSFFDSFVIMFINEILVYSKRKVEHAGHLCIMLDILKEKQYFQNS